MLLPQPTLLALLCFAAADTSEAPAEPAINPVPRVVLAETLHQWTFDRGDEGWRAEHQCRVSAADGVLKILSTGDDPFLHLPVDLPGGPLALVMKVRSRTAGTGAVYWTTDRAAGRGEDKVARFPLQHEGQWHETTARFLAPGRLRDLRIDPGTAPGEVEVDWIRLVHEEPHPLTIQRAERVDRRVRFEVKNHRDRPLEFLVKAADGDSYTIEGGATIHIDRRIDGARPLEAVSLELLPKNGSHQKQKLPPVRRTIFLHNPETQTDWVVLPSPRPAAKETEGAVSVQVAADGSMARIRRGGRLVGLLGPLVHCDGKLPEFQRKLLERNAETVRFQGQGITLSISIVGKQITVAIDSRQPCEGPVVRALGSLEQGLLAGLEYLGKGERSSSKLDIETAEHLRFAPDLLKVTMPLMSFVTDRATMAMTWSDMTLQPVYATPNFFDGADDHRMALRGKKIEATILVDQTELEETILWAVNQQGLPPLPQPPRSQQEQWAICLKGLSGPLKTEAGWGHCVQKRWGRQPYADMASTVWRLGGQMPELPRLVPGGGHVPNGTIYFVTGRAQQWLDHQQRQARGHIDRQQPDGSYRYDGKYRRGHFENTASGVCARPAAMLLEHARVTGDQAALAAGLRTLQYMNRFRTPRGAQVWEVPLHTPDQLASAYLVWAYVRGYELTGNKEYLQLARRWALSGVPFVYLWQRHPIMLYSTPPVFGATFWRHSWFGLPVQWVGGVYAYALTMLAPYDDSLDWNHLARGILLSAEQQQYPDGPYVGLLPDSFNLPHQRRQPADINPCALVSLRTVLDGGLDFLSVATDGKHRIAAPFPVTIRDGKAHIQGRPNVHYQVIIDGSQVVDVASQGEDVVRLPWRP